MLKLKKTLPALLVTASLLISSQSAFATTGYGDDISYPMAAYPNTTQNNQKIDSPTDVDWYAYTNNTGSPKSIAGYVKPPANKNYDVRIALDLASGYWYEFDMTDNGTGKSDGFGTSLQPGDTIYIRVKGHTYSDFDTANTYTFRFEAN